MELNLPNCNILLCKLHPFVKLADLHINEEYFVVEYHWKDFESCIYFTKLKYITDTLVGFEATAVREGRENWIKGEGTLEYSYTQISSERLSSRIDLFICKI